MKTGVWNHRCAQMNTDGKSGAVFRFVAIELALAVVVAVAPVRAAEPVVASDARLERRVSCAFKGMALSDLCDRLRADAGVALSAGGSVADEKVTIFCKELPLREVMRQLSRPFGYTWLRSGAPPGPPNAG